MFLKRMNQQAKMPLLILVSLIAFFLSSNFGNAFVLHVNKDSTLHRRKATSMNKRTMKERMMQQQTKSEHLNPSLKSLVSKSREQVFKKPIFDGDSNYQPLTKFSNEQTSKARTPSSSKARTPSASKAQTSSASKALTPSSSKALTPSSSKTRTTGPSKAQDTNLHNSQPLHNVQNNRVSSDASVRNEQEIVSTSASNTNSYNSWQMPTNQTNNPS